MHNPRISHGVLVALVGACLAPAAASAQEGPPPPPTATGGQTVKTVAQGFVNPTQMTFGKRRMFVAAFGSEDGSDPGGVFAVRKGKVRKIFRSPSSASGVVYHRGKLYVSSRAKVYRYSKWNGRRFRVRRAIYTGPEGFSGFAGLAFGPDGRLYSGVGLGGSANNDPGPPVTPFEQRVMSMTARGRDLRTEVRGVRQPWMLTFVKGIPDPFVSVLAAENTEPPPPDWIIKARRGQNYGFPTCTRAPGSENACRGFAKPIALLENHASPMGISSIGRTLYVALFGGLGEGPAVVSMTTSGKRIEPLLAGAAPFLGLVTHRGRVYVSDVTGSIYRVTP
jgi:glucose/arabinose dehydrogenase